MAKDSKPPERLFIKVILPKQGAERKVPGGGTKPKPFRAVNEVFRQSLSKRVNVVKRSISTTVKRIGAAPARITLISKAIAKSHRPETIFSEKTCPIIGGGKVGELFIRATPAGLDNLNRFILKGKTDRVKKELSTIETVEPITPEYRRQGLSPSDILRHSPKVDGGYVTKVQLFDLDNFVLQSKLVQTFIDDCAKNKIEVIKRAYSDKSYFFETHCKNIEDVESLSKLISVRSIKRMPVLRSIRGKIATVVSLPTNLPLPDTDLNAHPIVAVVDSGISDQIPSLNQWVAGRESTVAKPYRNIQHGTFVGGLICWASDLNPDLKAIDLSPCRLLDIQVFPNDDPGFGDVEFLTESQLLQDLEAALQKHANEVRVWNISLGSDEVCSLDSFSSFAIELDNLQERYNVSFVVSVGNYGDNPLLDYPRVGQQLDAGRITTPADSVLSISVGSVAHKSHKNNGPKYGEPSAFSRHGAGPNYIIKPDLVHYGGTCSTDKSESFGIKSVSGSEVGESFGTSFSTPIVSRLLANIYHNITPTPSSTLARALLTHQARDPRSGDRVPDNEENFIGFGIPSRLQECIECNPWSSTLVFEDSLRSGYYLDWNDFPYPQSLRKKGRFFGDIWMTIAFSPLRNERWGSEYCESHIDAHFGVYYKKKNRETGAVSEKFKGLVPPEHKAVGLLHESFLVANLRKWAPVRTYFGSLGDKGERGDRWRLKVQLLTRHDANRAVVVPPQRFALILTIADPDKKEQIYNEMAMSIRSRFQAENLALRTQPRVQLRPKQ